MHVVLIADSAYLLDELGLFRSLRVGLMDEQVQVSEVLPQSVLDDKPSAFGRQVGWRETSLALLTRFRLSETASQLQELKPDLLHAMDGRLWRGALALAGRLQLPVVLQANEAADVARAIQYRRHIAANRASFLAITEPIAQALKKHVSDPSWVMTVPHGVYAYPSPTPAPAPEVAPEAATEAASDPVPDMIQETDKANSPVQRQANNDPGPFCIVVTGSGKFDEPYQVCFEALARIVADHPDTLLFLDSTQKDQHALWRGAHQFGLQANISMIPRRIGHKDLLFGAHLLVSPQAMGRARSVTLQAMGSGVPVLALADDWLDYLEDGQNAWVVPTCDPLIWYDRLSLAIHSPDDLAKLCVSARAWVKAHRQPSQRIEATIQFYQQVTGQAYLFEQQK